MKLSRGVGMVSALLLLVAGIWHGISPAITLQNMRDAANAKDGLAISEYVDFPVLREDMKVELSALMMAEIHEDKSFGAVLGLAFMDKIIDNLVTPAGIGLMFTAVDDPENGKEGSRGILSVRPGVDKIMIERSGISEFRVHGNDGDKGALVFHRYGLGWKLVGIDLRSSK